MKTEEQKRKHREYMREWVARNRQKVQAINHKSYERHREDRIAKVREYQVEHKEDRQKYMKAYQLEHRGEALVNSNAHWHKHRPGVAKGAPLIKIDDLAERDEGICGICAKPVTHGQRPSIDHIIALSKGGGHSWDNVRYTHLSCNMRAGSTLPNRNSRGQFTRA